LTLTEVSSFILVCILQRIQVSARQDRAKYVLVRISSLNMLPIPLPSYLEEVDIDAAVFGGIFGGCQRHVHARQGLVASRIQTLGQVI
jgi:hypothetical protein